jgi:AcrR family transcriptional regulator
MAVSANQTRTIGRVTSDVPAAVVRAGWLAVEHLARNGAGATVRELADAAGISERTFYRYFPTREDVLRPVMRDAQDDIARGIAAQPDDARLGEALLAGFIAAAAGEHLDRTRLLLPVLFGSASYTAVWSQELRRHQPLLRSAVARRLGRAPDDIEVEVTIAMYLSLVELALSDMVRTGQDPAQRLHALFRAVPSDLLAMGRP